MSETLAIPMTHSPAEIAANYGRMRSGLPGFQVTLGPGLGVQDVLDTLEPLVREDVPGFAFSGGVSGKSTVGAGEDQHVDLSSNEHGGVIVHQHLGPAGGEVALQQTLPATYDLDRGWSKPLPERLTGPRYIGKLALDVLTVFSEGLRTLNIGETAHAFSTKPDDTGNTTRHWYRYAASGSYS